MKPILILFSLLLVPFSHLAQAQEGVVGASDLPVHGDPPRPSTVVPSLPSGLQLHAQPVTSSTDTVLEAWVARYDGTLNHSDGANALAVDNSGNVYVTGYSWGFFKDYATIKYDASGVEQWVARYDGGSPYEDDEAAALAVDNSGNVYVTGYSFGGSYNSEDYLTIKYDGSGVQQWVARYIGIYNGSEWGSDVANALAVDNSGNVYVTGVSQGFDLIHDYATIKYNSSGAQQWVKRYNGSGNETDGANALVVDNSENVYVTGYSVGSGTDSDYATIKYNTFGVLLWAARYNGPENGSDHGREIAVDGSGNVYVTGWSTGSGTSYDFATIKYDASGGEQWVVRYNGPGNSSDYVYALAVDADGNVYVTGKSYSGTNNDYATIKYDASGVEQWVARYNGPGNGDDVGYALAVDADGNVYVTGQSGSYPNYDYATIKYNASGAEQWVSRYNGPGNSYDYAYALAADNSGNIYVTGSSAGSGTFDDYATIKYTPIPCTVYLDLQSDPIHAEGDTITVNVTLTNNIADSQKVDFWTTLQIPDGTVRDMVGPKTKGLTPFEVFEQEVQIFIPGTRPHGEYTLVGYVGRYPSVILDSASAGFTKLAILYDGGPFVNNPGGGVGGADESVVQNSLGLITLGFNHDPEEIRVADDFTVSSSEGWVIDSLELYAYQTFSGTTSTITTIYYRIWDGAPNDPGSTVIFGDMTTNRLVATDWSNIYRVPEASSGNNTDRPVMKNSVSAGVTLAAGTYWIEWATEGTLTSGPWAVPITINGQTVTGNALQYNLVSGVWTNLVDAGTGTQQGLPFLVYGSVSSQAVPRLQAGQSSSLEQIPTDFSLSQNYPNPFNPSTTIRYALPEKAHVKLEVFNMLGQSVALLVDGEQAAGYHSAVFEGSGLASGVYVYRLSTTSFVQTKRLVLIR